MKKLSKYQIASIVLCSIALISSLASMFYFGFHWFPKSDNEKYISYACVGLAVIGIFIQYLEPAKPWHENVHIMD